MPGQAGHDSWGVVGMECRRKTIACRCETDAAIPPLDFTSRARRNGGHGLHYFVSGLGLLAHAFRGIIKDYKHNHTLWQEKKYPVPNGTAVAKL